MIGFCIGDSVGDTISQQRSCVAHRVFRDHSTDAIFSLTIFLILERQICLI